jgi:hypothetical protein
LPFHQLAISSTCQFINLLFHQFAIFINLPFISLPFHQLAFSSVCHFYQLAFYLFAILSICYFVNMPNHLFHATCYLRKPQKIIYLQGEEAKLYHDWTRAKLSEWVKFRHINWASASG